MSSEPSISNRSSPKLARKPSLISPSWRHSNDVLRTMQSDDTTTTSLNDGVVQVDLDSVEQRRIQMQLEQKLLDQVQVPDVFTLKDIFPMLSNGMEVIVQDGFWMCFQSNPEQPWNWNWYLYTLWVLGIVLRYGILFPIRLLCLLIGSIGFWIGLLTVRALPMDETLKLNRQRQLMRFWCSVMVFSWTGVIKYHGTLPKKKTNQIHVANHSSIIDVRRTLCDRNRMFFSFLSLFRWQF